MSQTEKSRVLFVIGKVSGSGEKKKEKMLGKQWVLHLFVQVAGRLLEQPRLCGLQGPTISPIYNKTADGSIGECGYFDCTICVPKKEIYAAVKGVRQVMQWH